MQLKNLCIEIFQLVAARDEFSFAQRLVAKGNVISDERGKPRVISCLAATLRLRCLDFARKERKRRNSDCSL